MRTLAKMNEFFLLETNSVNVDVYVVCDAF